jgi:hypothetical protein
LPANALSQQPTSWLANDAGAVVLFHAFPVYSDERRQAMLGHGLIRLDFMPALLHQQTLQFTDLPSVRLTLKPGETLA